MDVGLIRLNSTTGEITFELGDNPPLLTGMNKLVQIVLITLLTTAGTDRFDNYGGGLLNLLGKPLNPRNSSGTRSEVSTSVNATQAQILAEQTDSNLPNSERLRRIDLVDVNINIDLLEVEVLIRIINVNDEIAFVRL